MSSINTTTNVTSAANKSYGEYNSTAKKEAIQTTSQTKTEEVAAVYEKQQESSSVTNYTINKMTKEQRASLVEKLKEDQAARQQSLVELAQSMITKQSHTFVIASEDDVWKFLASGDYTVDAETKAKAQEDISEDGYYGVKQTSQRLFDFACALAGDDVDKMKEMQAAIEKGYKKAEKTWGKELPEICQQTLDATNKMFDDYYASKENTTVEE